MYGPMEKCFSHSIWLVITDTFEMMPREKPNILPVDPANPDKNIIAEAARIAKEGGLIVFPTSTFYGLGAVAFDPDAVARVFQVKKRDPGKPLLILITSEEELSDLVRDVPPMAERLIRAFWPGKITLVFEARAILSENLSGGTGKVGVRLAGHPVARALVDACGPVTGTSANLSGQGGCASIDALDKTLVTSVDCVLDAGQLPGIAGSTVVDVTVFPPQILREGVVPSKEVETVWKG